MAPPARDRHGSTAATPSSSQRCRREDEKSGHAASAAFLDRHDGRPAHEAWNRLVDWMQRVLFVRYPPVTEVLKDCWFAHPKFVEHLSWLHVSWALAYRNPKASIVTAAEWLNPCYTQHVNDSRVPPERYGGFTPRSPNTSPVSPDATRYVETPCPSPGSPPGYESPRGSFYPHDAEALLRLCDFAEEHDLLVAWGY